MKVKTAELIGKSLDWAVCKARYPLNTLNPTHRLVKEGRSCTGWFFIEPASTDWDIGGPIIEQEWLHVEPWPNSSNEDHRWSCTQYDLTIPVGALGPTPLIAAMRCYVASKLGDEVEVPF